MSVTSDASPPGRLSFGATVDRALIHRRNPDEAFLADAVQTGAHSFVAAALLPPTHHHYTAHTGPSRDRDPMLLLECARQAETYAAHTMYGVEPDARFVLRNWSAEFASLAGRPTGTELLITAVTRNPRVVRDQLRGLDYDMQLWAADVRIGRVRMEVGYLSGAAYSLIRSRKHNGSPPSVDEVVAAGGRPVTPSRVGRFRATDVVLLDAAADAGAVTARLRVPAENPSLFDHAQDHLPAMVLMEGARQVAALATHEWGGAPPDRTRLAAMRASFDAYAELTEPVELVASPAPPDTQTRAMAGAVDVAFRQGGVEIARARIVMAGPVADRGRGRETP